MWRRFIGARQPAFLGDLLTVRYWTAGSDSLGRGGVLQYSGIADFQFARHLRVMHEEIAARDYEGDVKSWREVSIANIFQQDGGLLAICQELHRPSTSGDQAITKIANGDRE
jgi:hypothetical protein